MLVVFSCFSHEQYPRYDHNNSVMVKNINGTSKAPYKVDKLYGRYVAAGGNPVETCQVKGCCGEASATAHVLLTDGRRKNAAGGRQWRLTRFCATHNNHENTEEMPLRKNAVLLKVREVRETTPVSASQSVSPNNTKATKSSESTSVSPSKTVLVAEHVKRNGTVVAEHLRAAPSSSSKVSSNSSPSPEKTVHVAEHVRRDGTVVAEHFRAAPTPRSSSSTNSPTAPGKSVCVAEYKRSDGTVVAEHYRSAPSPSKASSSSSSPSSTSSSSSSSSSSYSSSSTSGSSSGSCAGRTYVSSYVRGNGTVVAGYYR